MDRSSTTEADREDNPQGYTLHQNQPKRSDIVDSNAEVGKGGSAKVWGKRRQNRVDRFECFLTIKFNAPTFRHSR
jgi:hypothetical protein